MHTAIVRMLKGNLKVRIKDVSCPILLTADAVGINFLPKKRINGMCFFFNLFKKKWTIHAHITKTSLIANDWHK